MNKMNKPESKAEYTELRKKGQWKYAPHRGTYCGVCDENIGSAVSKYNNFCPNCGSDMREVNVTQS